MFVSEKLGRFTADFHNTPVGAEVMHHARRALVDWYGALLAGYPMAPTPMVEKSLALELDQGKARLPLGRAASTRAAALINGTASHTAEVDDIYREAIYHPGAPTFSAAMAVGQALEVSGMEFLKAAIAGYETSTRIGRTLGRTHYQHWHNTGTVGTFGAATAAAYLLGLNAVQTANAIALSATFAAGLQQAFKMDSLAKPLHSGRAAEAGVTAAMMAQQGVISSLDVFEGEAGLGHAMSNSPDWSHALDDLGTAFNINSMTFKNHACCGHTFAPIDGVLTLQQRHGIDVQDIEKVVIATYSPAIAVAGNSHPTTAPEARFSITFVVATALIHGSVRLAAFEPERLASPAIRALMSRIELQVDETADARFPGQRSAQVSITTKGGQQHSMLQPTRKGDPDLPLTDAELNDKFLELGLPTLGEARSKTLSAALWKLDEAKDLGALC
ncbi:MmgE/PrpD family protein [Diaphorobacter aerolatus]|uniref:MmgE/PrpD family protein n=1 Tax=Diaphorobacter aerolatus TaxID=1288495 RepID=A0A7H0GKR9_9BURK|nr:MmgE/PrpD family protein [Diaphorobacter aerolatus]QNP48885.1 MmgE/PrpD family protein [Diaphorobacter aerolatus]